MNLTENLKKPVRAREFSVKCDMLGGFMKRQNRKVWKKIVSSQYLNCKIM